MAYLQQQAIWDDARRARNNGIWRAHLTRLGMNLAPVVARWAVGKVGDAVSVGADIISGRLENRPGTMPSLRGTAARQTAATQQGAINRAHMVFRARLRGGDVSTPSTPMTNMVVPAQTVVGRGAELSVNQLNVETPIKHKTGEVCSRRSVDAFSREAYLFRNQNVCMAFAFKAILVDPSFLRVNDSLPVNRFVCHNVFRHCNALTGNISNSGTYGTTSTTWNNTLGPDRSLVRQIGGVGTAYAANNTAVNGLNVNFESPYRYPQNGGVMFARMSRVALENLGWNANPLKFRGIDSSGTIVPTTPSYAALNVYANAPYITDATQVTSSIPCQCPTNVGDYLDSFGPSCYYRSQMGVGTVAYTFTNDGLNPVVIDVVITRLKKSQQIILDSTGTNISSTTSGMVSAYQQGYLNYSLANTHQLNFQGEQPTAYDVTTNSRGPFLPAKALKTPQNGTTNGSLKDCPYKQVSRDQFIVAGGGQRDWSFQMQSLDYDARRYAEATYGLDDLSYIVSFGISGLPLPYIETGTSGTSNATTIIDRRGAACNVSITGTYREVVKPVYLTKPSEFTYVNGKLDIPGFNSGTAVVSTADLANLGQAVRSQTTGSAILNVSPFNTIAGA